MARAAVEGAKVGAVKGAIGEPNLRQCRERLRIGSQALEGGCSNRSTEQSSAKHRAFKQIELQRSLLIADAMLEFPDSKGGEQKALCSRQRSDSRQFFFSGLSDGCFPRTAALRLGFSSTARGFTYGEVAGVVHGGRKSSFQAMVFPLVRASFLNQFARSCLRIGNWDA